MRDIQLKKWNSRKIVVAGIGAAVLAGIAYTTAPKYGLINIWDKNDAIEKVEEQYTENIDSLESVADSLGKQLSQKDLALIDEAAKYKSELTTISQRHLQDKEKLKKGYQRELQAAQGSSLEKFMSDYPDFNPDRDYHHNNSNLGSVYERDAKDIEGYFALRQRLEQVLNGVTDKNEILGRVLAGQTTLKVMDEKSASKHNAAAVFDPGYWGFEFNEGGNLVGLGRKLNNYPLGGKK